MLAQLIAILEPLVKNHGVFLAMGFVLVVFVPLSLWLILRGSQGEVGYGDIERGYGQLAELKQQLNGWQTLIRQQLAQRENFTGKTRLKADGYAPVQEQALQALKALESQHKEVEALWGAEDKRAAAETEKLLERFDTLQSQTQPSVVWYKNIPHQMARSRTRLHDLQSRVMALQPHRPILLKQLKSLQGIANTTDPTRYLEAIDLFSEEVKKAEQQPTEQPAELPPMPPPVQASPDQPVTEAPVAEQPVAEQPVAEQPVAEQPVTEAPVAEQPVAEQPVTEEPVTEEPVTEEPITEEPVTEEPITEEPITEEPVAEQPVTLRKVERAVFDDTEAKMKTLRETLKAIQHCDQQLANGYRLGEWREVADLEKEAKHLLKEAETLLLLAYRLEKTPQAAPHRVKLNLKRCEDRLPQMEKKHLLLKDCLGQLEQRTEKAQSQLDTLTHALKDQQHLWNITELQDRAERLLQVRNALQHPPVSLQEIEAQLAQLKKEQSEKSKTNG